MAGVGSVTSVTAPLEEMSCDYRAAEEAHLLCQAHASFEMRDGNWVFAMTPSQKKGEKACKIESREDFNETERELATEKT